MKLIRYLIAAALVALSGPAFAQRTLDGLIIGATHDQVGSTTPVANVAALRALTASFIANYVDVNSYFAAANATSDGGGGIFAFVPSDTTTADNGATVIVDAASRRWYRVFNGQPLTTAQLGCKNDGVTDCQTQISALPTLANNPPTLKLQAGTTFASTGWSFGPSGTRVEGAPNTIALAIPCCATGGNGFGVASGQQLIGGNYQSNDIGLNYLSANHDSLVLGTAIASINATSPNDLAISLSSGNQRNVNIAFNKISSNGGFGILTNVGADIIGMKTAFNDFVTTFDCVEYNGPSAIQQVIVTIGNTCNATNGFGFGNAKARFNTYIGNAVSYNSIEQYHFEDAQFGNTVVGNVGENLEIGYRVSNGTGGVPTTLSRAMPVVANNFQANQSTAPVTIGITSPCGITDTAHGFAGGAANIGDVQVSFSTTGALPTGIVAGQTYFVIGSSINPNTYTISATLGGAAINCTGSQSGTQTRTRVASFGLFNVFDGAGSLGFMGYASNYLFGFQIGLSAGQVAHTIADNNVFDSDFQGVASLGGSVNGRSFFKNITSDWGVAQAQSAEFGRFLGDTVPVNLINTTGRSGVGSVLRDGFEYPFSGTCNTTATAIPFVQMPNLAFGRVRVRATGDNTNFGYYSATLKFDGTTISVADVISKFTGTFSVGATPFTTVAAAATVTISIAAPAVITDANHILPANAPVVFTTSGALPTGITSGTTYFVSATGLAAGSYQISAYPGGPSIITTGTQSGTQTRTANAARLAFNCIRSDGPITQAFTVDFSGEYYKE